MQIYAQSVDSVFYLKVSHCTNLPIIVSDLLMIIGFVIQQTLKLNLNAHSIYRYGITSIGKSIAVSYLHKWKSFTRKTSYVLLTDPQVSMSFRTKRRRIEYQYV